MEKTTKREQLDIDHKQGVERKVKKTVDYHVLVYIQADVQATPIRYAKLLNANK